MAYRFDAFQIDPAARELRRDGELVALPARAFDCLAYLIEHRERAVGRDELIAAVWGRVEISDALLSHTVLKVRRALGDTGNGQRTIRTVPRFGYRWVQSLQPDAQGVPGAAAGSGDGQSPTQSATAVGARERGAASTRGRALRRVALAAALLGFGVLLFVAWRSHRPPSAASDLAVAPEGATSVLVLPADVSAADDWQWLRFGLMDLVANRLRSGAVQTAPSETVVSLLRARAGQNGQALLHDASLGEIAALRVLPSVSRAPDGWHVQLDAFGAQRAFRVQARADDAIEAGRGAADALLRRLGHAPNIVPSDTPSPALDALLQRSGAAMLADQLEQARALIASAPLELQRQPALEQRMAQIELRSGDYAAVESRLHALLDRLPAGSEPALRARALLTLAASYVRRHQPDKAVDLYAEAIALRQDPPDSEVLGIAHLGHGSVLAEQGRYDEAIAELSTARTELETVGDALGVASVDVNLGDFHLMRHRAAEALPLLVHAVHEFDRLGAREGRAYALTQQAIAEGELLDVDAALATTLRFWPPEANTSNLRMRWSLILARAEALSAAGRLDAASALVERIGRESDPAKDALARAGASLLAASMSNERGDDASASITAAMQPVLRDADPIAWTRGLLLQGRILRADGQRAAAAAVVAAQQAWAGSDPWRQMVAALGEAQQAWAEQRREAALEAYARAMRSAESLNVPADLVAVGAPYLGALIDASQLDAARTVAGRIAIWADRDLRTAEAQAQLFHALGQSEAARQADERVARWRARARLADDAPG